MLILVFECLINFFANFYKNVVIIKNMRVLLTAYNTRVIVYNVESKTYRVTPAYRKTQRGQTIDKVDREQPGESRGNKLDTNNARSIVVASFGGMSSSGRILAEITTLMNTV